MDLKSQKQALRRQILERTQTLSREYASEAGSRAAEWIVATPEFENASVVAVYAALAGEIDARALFGAAMAAGKKVCAPRCCEGLRLEFAAFAEWQDLHPGKFGVLEPGGEAELVDSSALDLVIVPGVAFDGAGRRLGRGAGYYDRAFPRTSGPAPALFGLAFSFQVLARVPTGCHDRRMDAVCTEQMLLRAPPTQGDS